MMFKWTELKLLLWKNSTCSLYCDTKYRLKQVSQVFVKVLFIYRLKNSIDKNTIIIDLTLADSWGYKAKSMDKSCSVAQFQWRNTTKNNPQLTETSTCCCTACVLGQQYLLWWHVQSTSKWEEMRKQWILWWPRQWIYQILFQEEHLRVPVLFLVGAGGRGRVEQGKGYAMLKVKYSAQVISPFAFPQQVLKILTFWPHLRWKKTSMPYYDLT